MHDHKGRSGGGMSPPPHNLVFHCWAKASGSMPEPPRRHLESHRKLALRCPRFAPEMLPLHPAPSNICSRYDSMCPVLMDILFWDGWTFGEGVVYLGKGNHAEMCIGQNCPPPASQPSTRDRFTGVSPIRTARYTKLHSCQNASAMDTIFSLKGEKFISFDGDKPRVPDNTV